MIPIIDDFVRRFSLTDFIVVADSGLMSERNVNLLESAGYKYILGAQIRSESPRIKEWILSIEKKDDHCEACKKNETQRLIVSYSDSRARKNAWNRDKGVARLRTAFVTIYTTLQQEAIKPLIEPDVEKGGALLKSRYGVDRMLTINNNNFHYYQK